MKLSYRSTLTACYTGYVVQAVVNNFVPLLFLTFQSTYGISLSRITILITVNFLTQLTVDMLSAGFVDRAGYRASAIAAHVFALAGLAGLAFLPDLTPDPFAGLLISIMIYAVGGGLLLWTWLAGALGLGQLLWAAGMTAIPLLITGGIHLDGFCDVCDALASHQSRERKLEIMADPHVGAFAVQGCGLLLLLTFGLWCQAERTDGGLWAALLLVPVLSRGLSAFAALTLPNARGGGLLAAVTGERRRGRWLPLCGALLCAAGLAVLKPGYLWIGGAALLALWYYVKTAKREFGGTTGDLAGWFLQLCELACLAGLVLAQSLEGVL